MDIFVVCLSLAVFADIQGATTLLPLAAASQHVGYTTASNYTIAWWYIDFVYLLHISFNIMSVAAIIEYPSTRYVNRSSRPTRVANCSIVAALISDYGTENI